MRRDKDTEWNVVNSDGSVNWDRMWVTDILRTLKKIQQNTVPAAPRKRKKARAK